MLSVLIGVLKRFGIGFTVVFKWTGYRKKQAATVSNYKFFQDSEIVGLDKELVAMLDIARGKAGVPFTITSGKRTFEENSALKDSVGDSAHLTGLAVDLACEDNHALQRMIHGLDYAGFNRIGIYIVPDPSSPYKFVPRHIHVDVDKTKSPEVAWIVLER